MNRQEWIACLAKLTTPYDPPRATAAMLAYLPFLSDLPDAAFNPDSLEHVAMSARRLAIPDLAEVKRPLSEWWQNNRPQRPRIAAQPSREKIRHEASQEARNAVAGLLRGFTGHVAKKPHLEPRQNVIAPEVLAEIRANRAKTG